MAINQAASPKNKKELTAKLGISKQNLYYKPKLPEKDLKLKAKIEKVMICNKAYGHKRITLDLRINKYFTSSAQIYFPFFISASA